MARKASFEALTAAIRAPFVKRYGLLSSTTPVDHSESNDYRHLIANAANSYDVEVLRLDSDNVLRVGADAQSPMVQSIQFAVATNASLGATTFFVATQTMYIQAITEVHKTAGTNGSAVTAVITRERGNQAPGAGTSLMTNSFNMKGTINVNQSANLNGQINSVTDPLLVLVAGDRLSFATTGVLTTLAGVVVTVYLTPGSKGEIARYYAHVNGDLSTSTIFCSNRDFTVQSVRAIYGTAFAAAVTIDVTNDSSTSASGAGTSVLSAAMVGDGAINTLITPTLAAAAALYVPAGNRLAVKFSAVTTGADLLVEVVLQPIYQRKEVTFKVGVNAQQQVNQPFWISDGDYVLEDVSCIFGTAAGGAATGGIEILRGTTAAGSGTLTHTAFNLNSAAATVQVGTLGTLRNRQISAGQKLSYQATSGAAQSLADLCITCSLAKQS